MKEIKEVKIECKKKSNSIRRKHTWKALLEAMKNERIPRPFTIEKEIRVYLELEQNEKIFNGRLSKEIRYARVTSISLKLASAVFRLKWNYQDLTSTKYAETLMSYLNSTRCYKRITVDDLCNIMHGIDGQTDAVETVVDKENDTGWR